MGMVRCEKQKKVFYWQNWRNVYRCHQASCAREHSYYLHIRRNGHCANDESWWCTEFWRAILKQVKYAKFRSQIDTTFSLPNDVERVLIDY